MDSEIVLSIAKQLTDTCVIMDDNLKSLYTSLQSLPWEGSAAEEFKSIINSQKLNFSKVRDNGLNLSSRVEQEVNEWLKIDQNYA
jgi:uncharacterized protein YukE